MPWTKEQMASYTSSLFTSGSTVNLGIGLPSLVADYLDITKNIMIHSENGVLGVEGRPERGKASPTLINAGKETISINKSASFFDSSLSFGMIRGGHLDYCVLGGMEVDTNGNLANWMIPGKKLTGMGGAMDLVNGAKNIFVLMTHFNKDGESKIVKNTQLPLTGVGVVNEIITDLGHFKINHGKIEILKLADGIVTQDCKFNF